MTLYTYRRNRLNKFRQIVSPVILFYFSEGSSWQVPRQSSGYMRHPKKPETIKAVTCSTVKIKKEPSKKRQMKRKGVCGARDPRSGVTEKEARDETTMRVPSMRGPRAMSWTHRATILGLYEDGENLQVLTSWMAARRHKLQAIASVLLETAAPPVLPGWQEPTNTSTVILSPLLLHWRENVLTFYIKLNEMWWY